ncbi:hypothetical protein [Acidovorax sp.]|uniref:hypothetical protein n=1 Tax=Acidovorax sp. TaxID=1872122 RepID=UPI004037BB52
MPLPKSACHASWNGIVVSVTARLVPRYAWTTASIDVFLEDQPILKTGGVFKISASHSEGFKSQNSEHSAEVSWGKATLRSFSIILKIDDAQVIKSSVPIQNWWLALWPWAALSVFVAWRVLA